MAKYISGRSKRTPQSGLTSDRYKYLAVNQAEPNLGDPSLIYPPLPVGQQYQIVSIPGYPGNRYWVPIGGGLIPGTISVYDENYLIGSANSITQLNFVGLAITAIANPLGIAATITVAPPGNNGSVLFKENGDFATSVGLVFNSSVGILTVGNGLVVGTGGTFFNVKSNGFVGIGTTNPTQSLDLNGNLHLTGTVYDYYNQPGASGQLLVKNALGGVNWLNQSSVTAGAGGTYQNVQYNNASGLLGGAPNFVFNEVTQRVGIGSTIPNYTLDVLGTFNVTGPSIFTNIYVSGITTSQSLNVYGLTTTRDLYVTGITTLGVTTVTNLTSQNLRIIGITTLGVATVANLTTQNLQVTGITTLGVTTVTNLTSQNLKINGISTVGFITGTSDAYFTGVVTATTFIGRVQSTFSDFTNINVTGIATIGTLGVTGTSTTRNLQVIGLTTLGVTTVTELTTKNLYVTGISTLGNVQVNGNTVSTPSGNLILDSSAGTTQINDAVYVNDSTASTSPTTGALIVNGGVGIGGNVNISGISSISNTTQSTNKDNGALVIDGGVGIERNLNVGGAASITGITTFGSNVLPYSSGTQDIGSTTQKWNYIYGNNIVATTFTGLFVGIANTADSLTTARTISATGDFVYVSAPFNGTKDVTGIGTLATTGVTSATYGSGTQVGQFAVNSKGLITSATNVAIAASGSNTYVQFNDNGVFGAKSTFTFNKNTDLLTVSNLSVGSTATFSGFTTTKDTTITGLTTHYGNVLPGATSTYDLGSLNQKWNNIYVNTVNGNIQGYASSIAVQLDTSNVSRYIPFVDVNTGLTTVRTDDLLVWNPSTNSLGIGTTNPTEKLSVYGAVESLYDTIGEGGQFILRGKTGTPIRWNIDNYSVGVATNLFRIFKEDNSTAGANGRTYVGITSVGEFIIGDSSGGFSPTGTSNQQLQVQSGAYVSGALGVGVANPTSKLEVLDGPGGTNGQLRLRTTGDVGVANTTVFLRLNDVNGSAGYFGFGGSANQLDVWNYKAGSIRFGTLDIERARFDLNGNLGISTTNPTSKFHLVGDALIAGLTTHYGNVLPGITNTYDLGSLNQKWNTVYANTFNGTIIGYASSIAVSSDSTNTNRYIPFVDVTAGLTTVRTDNLFVWNPSTNSLGIGSANPKTELDVGGSLGVANTITVDKNLIFSNPNTYLRWDANTDFSFIRFNSTSDSNPPSQLEISIGDNGDSYTSGRADSIVVNQYGLGGYIRTLGLLDNYGNTTIPGNIGIGTTTPTSKLHLVGDASIYGNILPGTTNTYDLGSSTLRWNNVYAKTVDAVTFTGNLSGYASSVAVSLDASNVSRYIPFVDVTAGLTTVRTDNLFVWNPSTNSLGIGTENPLTKLDVRGVITAGSNTSTQGTEILRGYYGNNGALSVIGSEYSSGGLVLGYAVKPSTTTPGQFYSSTAVPIDRSAYVVASSGGIAPHRWYIGANQTVSENGSVTMSEVMRLDLNGNLGIGIQNPTSKLHVSGTSLITGVSTFGDNILPTNNGTQNIGSPTQKWNYVYANNFSGQFIGIADTATKAYSLTTSRNFSITGDVTAPAISFDGTANVVLNSTLKSQGITANIYGGATSIPVLGINASGIITSVSTATIDFSGATVSQANTVKTTATSSNTSYYPTFVSSTSTGIYQTVYTDSDAGISYNPSTDVLSSKNLSLGSGSYFGTSPLVINGTTGDNDSHLVIKKPSQSAYSVLGWNGQVYQSANIYYSDGAWVHSAPVGNNNNQMFVLEPGRGVRWFASNNGTGSWNVANDVALWNDAGVWQNNVSGTASKLETPRTIAASADLTWSVSFDGSANVTSPATLATVNSTTGLFGSATLIPQITVNGKGLVTSVTTTTIDVSNASVSKAGYADKAGIATHLSSKGVNVNGQVPYQSGTDTTAFTSGTGASAGYLLQYNGVGNAPTWTNPLNLTISNVTYAGSAGIATVATYLNTAQSSSDQANITNRLNSGFWQTSGATTANGWPTTTNDWYHLLTSTHSNTANYYALQLAAPFRTQNLYFRATNGSGTTAWSEVITSSNIGDYSSTATNVTVVQKNADGTDYSCTAPITTNAGTITITDKSNAFGRKFLSDTDPTLTSTICNGDIWYKNSTIAGTDTGTFSGPVTVTTTPFFRNVPFIAANYTVTTAYNEMSIGPIQINTGVTVTVNLGATWTIV